MTGWPDILQIVDWVIAFTVIEFAVLAIHHHWTGAGAAPRDIGLNLISGLCLMLALRCALSGAGAAWIAVCLLAAGGAHATDLRRRWRRAPLTLSVSRKVLP